MITHFVPRLTVVVLALALPCPANPDRIELHVSPLGNDSWTGQRPEPAPDGKDGPLRTPWGALHRLRMTTHLQDGARVTFHAGEYELDRPLAFTQEDSGTQQAPIEWIANRGDAVVFLGGRRITDWQPVTDPSLLGRLPEAARARVVQADLRALGITDFGSPEGGGISLYAGGRPMTLARWPNEGFVRIIGEAGGDKYDIRGTWGDRIGKWVYDGDRPARWRAESDVWVHGYWFWDWSDQRHKVKRIDAEARMIEVEPPYHGYGYRKGQWYYYFNLFGEIDSPGEWYLDRGSGVIYFWPPEGTETDTYITVLPELITLDRAEWVRFLGITLEGARNRAVKISMGESVELVDCTIRNIAGDAVSINNGRNHRVRNCTLYHLGGGAIAMKGGDRPTLTRGGHEAIDNHIHDYGQWYRMYHAAISLEGVGLRASGNYIHDAPHMAIYFSGNDHLIENNEIHDVCLESNDAGAIYAGRDWTMRGTVIRNNYLHNITGFRDEGCVGVYLDDMFCGTVIENNLFYRVTRAAFIGGGRDNVVAGNVFVDCNPALHIDDRAMNWAADTVPTTMMERLNAMPYQDALWAERYPELPRILDGDPAEPAGNTVEMNTCVGGTWDEVAEAIRPMVRMNGNIIHTDTVLTFPESRPRAPDVAKALAAGSIGLGTLDFQRMDRRPE